MEREHETINVPTSRFQSKYRREEVSIDQTHCLSFRENPEGPLRKRVETVHSMETTFLGE